MLVVHVIQKHQRSGRHAGKRGVQRWQSSAPFPTAAISLGGDLIQCGPALTEEENLKVIRNVHSRNLVPTRAVPRSASNPMTSKLLRLTLAAAVLLTITALAQTSSTSSAGSPAALASSAPAPAAATTTPAATSTGPALKVGTISIQDAIFLSNEGHRDMDVLQKKLEPKQKDLQAQNDELEALKKQLNTQQDKLNPDALNDLKGQIESKQKTFDRAYQDFQEEVGNQQQEIASRVLKKMAPIVVKYAQDNGFGLIVDTSKPWPQSPILWWNQDAVDITKPVIDLYNVQSGVPAPAASSGTAAPKPSTAKPATGTGTTAKPPATKPTEPPK